MRFFIIRQIILLSLVITFSSIILQVQAPIPVLSVTTHTETLGWETEKLWKTESFGFSDVDGQLYTAQQWEIDVKGPGNYSFTLPLSDSSRLIPLNESVRKLDISWSYYSNVGNDHNASMEFYVTIILWVKGGSTLINNTFQPWPSYGISPRAVYSYDESYTHSIENFSSPTNPFISANEIETWCEFYVAAESADFYVVEYLSAFSVRATYTKTQNYTISEPIVNYVIPWLNIGILLLGFISTSILYILIRQLPRTSQ